MGAATVAAGTDSTFAELSPRISQRSIQKHYEYCIDHEAVRIDMSEENSFVRFHSGQYQLQFKAPFAIYADFEAILREETEIYGSFISEDPYTK